MFLHNIYLNSLINFVLINTNYINYYFSWRLRLVALPVKMVLQLALRKPRETYLHYREYYKRVFFKKYRQEKVKYVNTLINEKNLQNEITQECDRVLNKFHEVKRELLSITDNSNKQLQKIIIDPLNDYEYYNYFNTKNGGTKEVNTIRYGYTNRNDIEEQLKINEVVLLSNIYNKKSAVYNDHLTIVQNYIDKNLKRLGISKKVWDNMSDNDRNLLIDKFEK